MFSLLKLFTKNTWGIVQQPYATYRQLVSESPLQLFPLFVAIGAYFFFISPIKLHTLHPFLLTLNTTRLLSTAIFSFLLICLLLYGIGRSFGYLSGIGIKGIVTSWGYSLVPTLLWFFATSIFYVLLPPPRHNTFLGVSFSLLYISFSLSLLWWKGILYFLTLRFAMRLNLKKMIAVSSIFLPIIGCYSWILYRWGVFKVPFL